MYEYIIAHTPKSEGVICVQIQEVSVRSFQLILPETI